MTDPIVIWRLMSRRRVKTGLSGDGAFRRGGRWNLPGTRVVYCAESRALAAMEILVHVEDMEDFAAVDWQAIAAIVPADLIERPANYPDSWRAYPYTRSTQKFGSFWARSGRSPVLRVPSAVVPGEFNYLLNPEHPGFSKLKFSRPESFKFDPRLGG